jgi:hypothetical protein
MGFSKDITGMLPPPLAKLLRDDAAVNDMLVILGETQKILALVQKNPGSNPQLKTALADIAGVLPLVKTILEKKGNVSFTDAPKIISAFMNKEKYEAAGEVIADAFKAGDPAAIGFAQTLVSNQAILDAAKRVGPKLLPPAVQPLLQDKAIAADMFVVLGELELALDAAKKNPAVEKSLREAFNDVATAAAAVHTTLETGAISPALITQFALNAEKYRKSGQVLSDSFEAKDPAIEGFAQSLRKNEKIGALKRVVPKTHGVLFKLEQDASGQGYAVELLSGNGVKFPLDKADFDEIKAALKGAPKPFKGPGV